MERSVQVRFGAVLGFSVIVALALPTDTVEAQQGGAAHAHMGHVLDGFGATPDGAGLLPTAVAEAATADQHAGLAAYDPTNLEAMQRHANHVLHAVDPSRIESGPGLGFGVKQAAEGVAQHIGLAGNADGASGNVTTHSGHVSAAARSVAARADEIADVVERIQNAVSYSDAEALVLEMRALTGQLATGADANGDGQISWQEGEGGLDHAEQHMTLMASGEGLN